MTTFQIAGLIVMTLLGFYAFYCIYDFQKFNKKKEHRQKNKVMTMAVLLLAVFAGQGAWAQNSYSVTASTNDNVTTFTVTRSGDLTVAETVQWRLVSISAMEGIHYSTSNNNYSGNLVFSADQSTKTVIVTETPISNLQDRYRYQTGTSRYYRFEVLDQGGFELASRSRYISFGDDYKFSKTKLNKSVTDLVYFNNNAYATLNSNKYVDVSFTPPSSWVQSSGTLQGYVLIDDSYDYAQKPATVSTDNLINTTNSTRTFLNNMGCKIYATLCFTEKEEDDGYAYVQIIAGDASADYDGKDPDGKVNDPSNSVYKACFELYNNGSTVYDGAGKQFYPHRYDYVNRTAGGQSTSHTEFYDFYSYLWQHKYKDGYRAENSGSVVLSPTVNNITARFDANGSGDDTFGYKDLFFRLALCDATAPKVLTTNIITQNSIVSGGRHSKGNIIYVTVPFNEIVEVTGSPTLSTSWGTLTYYDGSGTNILTFRGEISADASGTFAVTSYSGTIKDLAGNEFAGTISKTFTGTSLNNNYTYSIGYDLAGGNESSANPTSYTWETSTITLNNPTKSFYDFAGWTGSNGSTPQTTVKIYTHSHGHRSYTANWTPTVYNITYNLAGGTLPSGQSNPATYTIETPTFTLVNPTQAGYDFDGWTGTGLTEPTQTVTIAQGSTDNRTYTANWFATSWSGTGTQDNPYIIFNTDQLNMLATRVNSASGDEYAASGYEGVYFKLGANITYSTEGLGDTDENFTAIGGYHDNILREFKGTFDGDNKTISGIRIYKSGTDVIDKGQALFGYLSDATIKNVILDDAHITGYNQIGGIAGSAETSTIENCIVINTTITSTSGTQFGAIVGEDVINTYSANYYHNCTANGTANAVNIGVEGADRNGARSVYTLTLGQDITAAGESVVIGNLTYYASNTTITLSYGNSIPTGYQLNYSYDDGTSHAIEGDTFTMPAANTTVSATIVPIVYTISYNLNNGNLPDGESNPNTYTIETPTFTLVNPVKTDDVFVGWTGTGLTELTQTVTIPQGSIGDRAYTARWNSSNNCQVEDFPWTEDFESYDTGDFADTCWVNEHISGQGNKIFNVYSSTSGMGGNTTKMLRLPDQNAGTMTKLVLPEMTLPANYEFSIDVYRSSNTWQSNPYELEGIYVYASTDGEIEGATELAFIPRHYQVGNDVIPAEETVGWYNYELPIGMSGTCYIILKGVSQYCAATYMDNFAVKAMPTCFKPTGLVYDNVAAHTATLSWRSDAEAWQICLNDDEENLIDVAGTSYTLTGLDEQTTYTAKVRTNCGTDGYSEWSNVVSFTTPIACPVPTDFAVTNLSGHTATLNWTGTSESYIVNYRTAAYAEGIYEEFNKSGVPSGWTKYQGLVNGVLDGSVTLTTGGGWVTTTYALGQYNLKLNIYGTSCKAWLVTPEFTLDQNLSFDLALTDYNNADPIENDTLQPDDRFIVLIYANDAWTILREWNNTGSQYVFNAIATTGENVTIDLSAYMGQNVKIAFYGESTASGGDNDLHIDNVFCGTPIPAGEWVTATTDTTTYTITGLNPEMAYEVKVASDCPGETGHETSIVSFTTDVACPVPTNLAVVDSLLTATTAGLNWHGSIDVDNYTVRYRVPEHTEGGINETFETTSLPSGWKNESGLLSNVMEGTALTNSAQWYFGAHNGVFDNHARINIYSSGISERHGWLITPTFTLASSTFTFDLALTAYNGTLGAPANTGTDDKFVVLISTDNMATWTILRQWDNEEGSTYVYNNIANTAEGEQVSIDLSRYVGQNVCIAFYGESTVTNADNNLHIDNVLIGNPTTIPTGEWQTASATATNVTLTSLTPMTPYEAQVKADCSDPEEWSNVVTFTTDAPPTFTKTIVAYEGNGGYHLIALPVSTINPVSVNCLTDNNFDLYRFNQAAQLEWENYKAHNNDAENPFNALVRGKGYLYANSETVTLSFTGIPVEGDTYEVTLSKNSNVDLPGWNLVGNPFADTAYIDRPFYVMNAGTEIIAASSVSRNYIEPMEGIFVVANTDGETLTFSTTAPSKGRGQTQEPEQIVIDLHAQRSTPVIDRAIVRFDDGPQLPKLQLDPRHTKVYIPLDGKDYAIVCAGRDGATVSTEIPVHFKAKENGEYTLTVSESLNSKFSIINYLHLIDNLTGADIDLLSTPSYTFSARSDDQAARFKLVFSAK